MNDASKPSKARTIVARSARILLVAGTWLLGEAATGEEPPKGPPAGAVLNLADGGFVTGTLEDSDRPDVVRWKAEPFADPFAFPRDQVVSIRFPVAGKPPAAVGAFGFELSGGDVVYGSLIEMDEDTAVLDIARFGRLRVGRASLRRIFRWQDGAGLIDDGPNGLAGWREVVPSRPNVDPAAPIAPIARIMFDMNINNGPPRAKPKPAPTGPGWVEEGRQLRATRDGATIESGLVLPSRSSIDLELAWTLPPDFTLSIGVSDQTKTFGRAFRLEVWDKKIVAVLETDNEADVAAIQPLPDGPGRARLRIYLDQDLGTIAIYSEAGESLASVKLGAPSGPSLPGVRLTNIRGDLRLERLRIDRWDGDPPSSVGAGANDSIVRSTDRSTVRGRVGRFDSTSREFVIRSESGESRVAEDRLDTLAFPRQGDASPRSIRVAYHDGTQLGGDWTEVGEGKLLLTVPGIVGLLRLPQDGLRSVDVLKRDAKAKDAHALSGTFEANGLRIPGYLVDTEGRPDGAALAWQPLSGGPPSAIRPGASGRIVYRNPQARAIADQAALRNSIISLKAVENDPAARVARQAAARNVAAANNPAPPQAPERLMPAVRRSLYLRTGDIIPVEVTKIDEAGVWFRTKFSKNGFVANDKVKAVELAPEDPTSIRVNKAKFERLLTLPRMQKENPPKHLIRSTNGDFLRGNVVGMNDKTIGIEVRLEEKVFPRDRISRIIWLHADETDPAKKPVAEPTQPGKATRVQAVRSDGVRLTFDAEGFASGWLWGKSEALGDCRVRVEELDQLLIGGSVEREATQLAYQSFKLQLATEPKSALFERGETPDGGSAGTESAMVGKPAPDFQLDLVGGGKFHLAEAKGQVIVLDFWATWCGPCLQAMPQIDRVTHEFADKGVKLIAVNLQETPSKITASLERQKLSPTVALDKDGVVAAKYGANAIPQTVVIDRDGKVTRLFIGGGPQLGDQLREALQAALMPEGGK